MLEKLIANLKESLPEPIRKKLGMVNNSSEDEDQSSDQSDESNEDSHDTVAPDDKKKKQISTIIRVIVILGLGYLAVDQFLLNKPEAEVAVVKPRVKKDKVVKPAPPATDIAAATTVAGAPPIETKPADATAPEKATEALEPAKEAVADVPAGSVEEIAKEAAKEPVKEPVKEIETVQPPVENINIAEKKTDAPKTLEGTPDKTMTDMEINAAMGETKSETQVDKSIDSLIDNVDGKSKETEKAENAVGEKKAPNLEDKIVADDVYVPPPVYDQLGRGLVYNCKEKYWACLDKLSYVACNKNTKWNKAHAKPAECVVQNVYNSDDDCSVVQKYNVSTSKATPFCQ